MNVLFSLALWLAAGYAVFVFYEKQQEKKRCPEFE
jgi:hypothetical protein